MIIDSVAQILSALEGEILKSPKWHASKNMQSFLSRFSLYIRAALLTFLLWQKIKKKYRLIIFLFNSFPLTKPISNDYWFSGANFVRIRRWNSKKPKMARFQGYAIIFIQMFIIYSCTTFDFSPLTENKKKVSPDHDFCSILFPSAISNDPSLSWKILQNFLIFVRKIVYLNSLIIKPF